MHGFIVSAVISAHALSLLKHVAIEEKFHAIAVCSHIFIYFCNLPKTLVKIIMPQTEKSKEIEKILKMDKKLITLEKLMVKCPECGSLFRDVVELKSHIKMTHHPTHEKNEEYTGIT